MSLVTIPSPSLSPVSGGPKDKFEGHLAVAVLRYPGNISRGPSHPTAGSCCSCCCCSCCWGLQWCGWGGDSTSGDGVRCWCQCWLSEEARSGACTVYSTALYCTVHCTTRPRTVRSRAASIPSHGGWRSQTTNIKLHFYVSSFISIIYRISTISRFLILDTSRCSFPARLSTSISAFSREGWR